jgi:hypothetical protein
VHLLGRDEGALAEREVAGDDDARSPAIVLPVDGSGRDGGSREAPLTREGDRRGIGQRRRPSRFDRIPRKP